MNFKKWENSKWKLKHLLTQNENCQKENWFKNENDF